MFLTGVLAAKAGLVLVDIQVHRTFWYTSTPNLGHECCFAWPSWSKNQSRILTSPPGSVRLPTTACSGEPRWSSERSSWWSERRSTCLRTGHAGASLKVAILVMTFCSNLFISISNNLATSILKSTQLFLFLRVWQRLERAGSSHALTKRRSLRSRWLYYRYFLYFLFYCSIYRIIPINEQRLFLQHYATPMLDDGYCLRCWNCSTTRRRKIRHNLQSNLSQGFADMASKKGGSQAQQGLNGNYFVFYFT